MARSVALAVDLGASGGRVVSGAFDGRLLELEEIHRFENAPVSMGGELVWDLVRLWQEVVTGLRAAAGRHGRAVATVGVDTWGVDFSFLGPDGSLLANPVCYRDARTAGMLAAAEKIVSREKIFAATGLQFMEINSLYQLLALKGRRSSVLAAAGRMLMIPDILHWLLSGEPSNEHTNASTTQCYDPRNRDWAFDMLERFGHGASWAIFGEDLPEDTNFVSLDPTLTDSSGLPAPKVSYTLARNSIDLMHFQVDRAVESMEASGARVVTRDVLLPHSGWHLMGTARMGDDPATSVVDRWSRSHDVLNLFVVDASQFVTSSGVNPTSTIAALALRAADRIVSHRSEIPVPS